ncbi:MAG: SDR family oxidoreductase [Thermoleophilaceae bacterium]|nr:SDR family oxidoreductase [Thermoleophilaceae bacterium]
MSYEVFNNKIAIITGAASGLGLGFAKEIGKAGGTVIAADIDLPGVEKVVAEIGGDAEAHKLDVRDSAAVVALVGSTVEKHGRIDYIFNNAGIAVQGYVEEIPIEDWDAIIDINLKGVAYGTSAAYKHMVKQGSGHIVNTASLAGLTPAPLLAPYSTVKFGVVGMCDSLRVEAQSKGVYVTALCPGFIDTAIYDNARSTGFDNTKAKESIPGGIVPLEKGVKTLLDGVVKRKRVVTLPWFAHLLILSYKLTPNISIKVSGKLAAKQAKKARLP